MHHTWESPDGAIKKRIVTKGEFGPKPYENCSCEIDVLEGLDDFKDLKVVVIGQLDGDLGRALELCLCTMHQFEEASFTLNDTSEFSVRLGKFTQEKLIFQMSASEKYDLALKHKEAGVGLFKGAKNKDAAHRFNKALKLLHSIPINVEQAPQYVDAVSVEAIDKLKCTLYNNLSSCYFKNQNWLLVIDICNKTLEYDPNNVKSLYKLAVSYRYDKNWEKSHEMFKKVLALEPNNKACGDHLKIVLEQVKLADKKANDLVKNMFK